MGNAPSGSQNRSLRPMRAPGVAVAQLQSCRPCAKSHSGEDKVLFHEGVSCLPVSLGKNCMRDADTAEKMVVV